MKVIYIPPRVNKYPGRGLAQGDLTWALLLATSLDSNAIFHYPPGKRTLVSHVSDLHAVNGAIPSCNVPFLYNLEN